MEMLLKAASVCLALGFSGAVLMLIRRCFGGWASDVALGRGAVLSLLTIVIAMFLSMVATICIALGAPEKGRIFADAFISAGLCEETARYIALVILLRGTLTHDPREFISGAAAIGLGFGVIENLLYISGTPHYLELGALRGVLSAPAHLSFAFLSAYGLWSVARRGKPFWMAPLFFLFAVLLHGFFDVALMDWPDPRKAIPATYAAWRLAGVGAAIVLAILMTTVSTLLTFTEFLVWADEQRPHDEVSTGLAAGWRALAQSFLRIAGILVFAPFVLGFAGNSAIGVLYAPTLIGAAGSLALWSMAITQLAE